ncbi:MAG: Ribonuclease HII, partial [uncultured Rubrobacteraceae bacterium]
AWPPDERGRPLRVRRGLDAGAGRFPCRRRRGRPRRPRGSPGRRRRRARPGAHLGPQRFQGARRGPPGGDLRRCPLPGRGRLRGRVPGVVDRPPRRRTGQPRGPHPRHRRPETARRLRPRRRQPEVGLRDREPAEGGRPERGGRSRERRREGPAGRRDADAGDGALRVRLRPARRVRYAGPPARAGRARPLPGPPPELRRGRGL